MYTLKDEISQFFLFFFKSYYLPYDNHNILGFLTDTLL